MCSKGHCCKVFVFPYENVCIMADPLELEVTFHLILKIMYQPGC